jgi:hypothetical protein
MHRIRFNRFHHIANANVTRHRMRARTCGARMRIFDAPAYLQSSSAESQGFGPEVGEQYRANFVVLAQRCASGIEEYLDYVEGGQYGFLRT